MSDTLKNGTAENPFWPLALRNGLIAGLILIAIGLVLQMTGLVDPANQQQGMNAGSLISFLINFLVMAGAAVLAVREYRDRVLGGLISLGGAFRMSMAVFLVIAVLTAVWTVLYMGLINPSILEMIREQTVEQAMERSGGELPEEAEKMMGFFTSPWFIAVGAFFGTLFPGLVIALLVGLVMKKEPRSAGI
jgi:large-conductance mechanosensitive channel